MSYAPNYTPVANFSQDESNNISGRSTIKNSKVDTEFTNISTSLNALNNNLKILQRSDGQLTNGIVTMGSLSASVKAALGGNPDSNQLLKSWAYAESFAVISATRNANNVITSANIKWPDGVSGVFTTDTINATFNTIDAWHATYLDTVTKTVTQTAVTRNAEGAVTAQPEITIS